MNLFIKYNKEFADMMKISESTSKCTRNKCNSLHENFIKKKAEIAEKIKKEADIIKGRGDAESIKIYANTYNKDYEFYDYYKSLELYKNCLGTKFTFLILSTNSNLLKYFNSYFK